MLRRLVLPEILDQLPENDPAAAKNRRDMRLLNHLMGNFRWIAREVGRARMKSGPWIELAAGDGSLGRYLAETHPTWAATCHFTGLDLCSRPPAWPEHWPWEQGDLLQSPSLEGARVVIANHILHQFEDEALGALGAKLRHAATHLIINETARRSLHLWQARAAFLLGLNHVSRHDALVSVRAGFRGTELPVLLGLPPAEWQWQIHSTTLGAYRFVAVRRREISS
jgi:hypothetical protein